jgi:hypothetical protein
VICFTNNYFDDLSYQSSPILPYISRESERIKSSANFGSEKVESQYPAGNKEDDRLYFFLILGLTRRGIVEIYFLFPMSFSEKLLN